MIRVPAQGIPPDAFLSRTSRNRLMSDPTALFDADKTWALLQVRHAKLLVVLRDPVPPGDANCRA